MMCKKSCCVSLFLVLVVMSTVVSAKGPVKINLATYHVGTDQEAEYTQIKLEQFRKQFGDRWEIEVEEIPGDQMYVDKMKVLLSTGKLPDIFEGKTPELSQFVINAKLAADLYPYMKDDPLVQRYYDPESIEIALRSNDGKVYHWYSELVTRWGYFYNEELFQKAGISEPARTWDEFWSQCDKLKAAGITPFALQTSDNSWTANHWLSALIASHSEEGKEFIETFHPTNYEIAPVIDSLKILKKMFNEYAQSDAIGANYNLAASSFLSGKTAMIANGPWMIGDFSNPDKAQTGFDQHIKYSVFPEGFYVGKRMDLATGRMVGAQEAEKIQAAVEWYKLDLLEENIIYRFIKLGRIHPNFDYLEDARAANPILVQFIENIKEHGKMAIVCYSDSWYTNVATAGANFYPLLVQGAMSAEDVAKEFSRLAQKNL